MTTMFARDETPLAQLTYRIYREAFRRIGHKLVYVYKPPLRGSLEADYGLVDGELGRGSGYSAAHPNLIRVDVPALFLTLSAYAIDPALHLNGWDSLRTSACRVEYRSGMQIPQSRLGAVVAPTRLSSVGTTLQGLMKLAAGRTDVYLDFGGHVESVLAGANFPNRERIWRMAYIERVAIHAYLHKSHADLERPLSAALSQMGHQGVLRQYVRESGLTLVDARARAAGGPVVGCTGGPP